MLVIDQNGNVKEKDISDISSKWSNTQNGEIYRNTNVGIGDFTSIATSYPLDVIRTNSDGNSAYFQGDVIASSNLLVDVVN